MKKIIALVVVLAFHLNTKAQIIQEWGVGVEGIYNVPINEIGFGARAHLHFNERWVVSPQFSYFPGFTAINEFYLGANVHFNFTPETRWGLYALVGPHYNHWINWASSSFSKAQLANLTGELGGGIVRNSGCIRPFFEYRANSKWWESNLRLGILVYFGDCSGRGRNKHICPAYTSL